MNKGKLYIVATPIGNLEDITLRAIDILKKVPFILAEDTRETKKLLDKYNIYTQLVSYRDQNHERVFDKILEKLEMGLDLALVSDNGTPLVSDPGFKLVKELRKLDYEIIPIPGASAVISAVSISGLPTDKFTFLGFLPKSDTKRKKILEEYIGLDTTLVIYESPNRLFRLLDILLIIDEDLFICAVRDMTKLHENSYWGNVKNVINELNKDFSDKKVYGEWVVVISKKN